MPGTLIAAVSGAAWTDLLVEIVVRRRVEERLLIPAVAEPLIVWVISGQALVEEREPGAGWSGRNVRAGDFFLTTSATPYEMRWQVTGPENFAVMHVYVGLSLMARASKAMETANDHLPRLREVSGERDATLSALLQLLRTEVRTQPRSNAFFVQGIAQSLALHLLRTYATPGDVPREQRGGLPVLRLRKVTDLLTAHLAEELPLARLAKEAGYSIFHFSRLFKKTTGVTPSRYLIRLRVEHARLLLRETGKSIAEVGLEIGYSNPSYFAQIFRQEVGRSPSGYRGSR